MTDLRLFRVYEPHECDGDPRESGEGYPYVWKRIPAPREGDDERDSFYHRAIRAGLVPDFKWQGGVKDLVRTEADHRCVRCRHPFVVGQSGTMEGPQASAKALAAELDADVEALDRAMQLVLDADDSDLLLAAVREDTPAPRRTNWSPCDEHCTHGGHVRARGVGEWEEHANLTVPQVRLLLTARCEVEAAWRILTVHHLNERKHDLRWWNLVALCQRCHLLIQRKVTMDRPWPWPHSDWFRPYVAGFYAYKYAGENLTREQVTERLDELLALGEREEGVERMAL